MRKSKLTSWIMAFACVGIFSCSSDDQETPLANVSVQARTTINSETSAPSVVAGANLLNGAIRLRDLALIQAGNPVSSNIPIGNADARQITLLNSGLPASATNIGTAVIPHGTYDRMRLRLDRGQQLPDTDPMQNRSLMIAGTVNNMLLDIYTDVEEIVTTTIQSSAQNINGDQTLYLNIDFNELFNGIDLRTAVDGDENGTIEIEPSNTDGNRALYNMMMNNLPDAITVTGS